MLGPIIYLALVAVCVSEMTAPGIEREMSEGVRSLGFKVMYGDEDMTVINHVVSDMEKSNVLKSRVRQSDVLPQMPATDVKCLMSVDKYCSQDMLHMKNVLIQALKEDCAKCTKDEKDRAGRIVASMLAYDSVAWKMFLTRYDGMDKVERILG